jgi:hypothetical protein
MLASKVQQQLKCSIGGEVASQINMQISELLSEVLLTIGRINE